MPIYFKPNNKASLIAVVIVSKKKTGESNDMLLGVLVVHAMFFNMRRLSGLGKSLITILTS